MRNIAKRHKFILNEIAKEGYVRVLDLSNQLNISEVTIRKDLKELEKRKLLVRNHGGASALSLLIDERHIDEKEKIQRDEKSRIATYAAGLLNPEDRIIIASGTTVLAFARKITDQVPITIITPSVKVTAELCYVNNIDIIQLGGTMRKSSASAIGYFAESLLKEMMCNKLFIGIDGLDLEHGLTTSNLGEAHLNQVMIKSAQKVIVLTDSTKFGKRGFGKICDIAEVDQIITDTNAPASVVEQLRESGVDVVLV